VSVVDVGPTGNTPCKPRSCVIVYTVWHSYYTVTETGNEQSDVCSQPEHCQPVLCVLWISDDVLASLHM
jgi:hypothetical protein